MEDSRIVELYWQRSELAIEQTEQKYGAYCFSIASSILPFREDAQESVNDTYLAAWESMPPNRPAVLSAFLGKLTRRIAISRYRKLQAQKRGGSTVPMALEELQECIPGGADVSAQIEVRELAHAVSDFLRKLPEMERRAFLLRYFHLMDGRTVAAELKISESKLRSMLHRTRKKLREYLRKEGY